MQVAYQLGDDLTEQLPQLVHDAFWNLERLPTLPHTLGSAHMKEYVYPGAFANYKIPEKKMKLLDPTIPEGKKHFLFNINQFWSWKILEEDKDTPAIKKVTEQLLRMKKTRQQTSDPGSSNPREVLLQDQQRSSFDLSKLKHIDSDA